MVNRSPIRIAVAADPTVVLLGLPTTGRSALLGISIEIITAPAVAPVVSFSIAERGATADTTRDQELLTDEAFVANSQGRRVGYISDKPFGEFIDLSKEDLRIVIKGATDGVFLAVARWEYR